MPRLLASRTAAIAFFDPSQYAFFGQPVSWKWVRHRESPLRTVLVLSLLFGVSSLAVAGSFNPAAKLTQTLASRVAASTVAATNSNARLPSSTAESSAQSDDGPQAIDVITDPAEPEAWPSTSIAGSPLRKAKGPKIKTFPYLPLRAGNRWKYDVKVGSKTKAITIKVSRTQVPIGGKKTTEVTDSKGDKIYFTNDHRGIRRHRELYPSVRIDGAGRRQVVGTYSPPLRQLPASFRIGQTNISRGKVSVEVEGFQTIKLRYRYTSKAVAIEEVKVPFGTFDAIRISETVTISGKIDGQSVSETESRVFWVAKDIAEVKSRDSEEIWKLKDAKLKAGISTMGFYDPDLGRISVRNSNDGGKPDQTYEQGPQSVNWLPVSGDWDSDSIQTVALYDPTAGKFHFADGADGSKAKQVLRFGPRNAGTLPLAGDWNGNGTDTVGLYNPATGLFSLKEQNRRESAIIKCRFGPSGQNTRPLAGDWTATGVDHIGVYNVETGEVALSNQTSDCSLFRQFLYNPAKGEPMPLSGDWDGNGRDSVGVYDSRSRRFLLRNALRAGPPNLSFRLKVEGSRLLPIAGDWDGL